MTETKQEKNDGNLRQLLFQEVNRLFEEHLGSAQALAREIRAQHDKGALAVANLLRNAALVAYPRNGDLIKASRELPHAFPSSFYAKNFEDAKTSATVLLSELEKWYRFRSVIDFGTGAGAWLAAAESAGAEKLVGIDNSCAAQEENLGRRRFIRADLESRIRLDDHFDLAICVEVAEHLHPRRSRSFVEDICATADVVVFGAALPRQYGDGHINCRPQRYWIEQFRRCRYSCLDAFRPHVWRDRRVQAWYSQNTFLYVHQNVLERFIDIPHPTMLDVYHPLLLFSPVHRFVNQDHRDETLW